jgi:multidrug efflux pump subunit AcrB
MVQKLQRGNGGLAFSGAARAAAQRQKLFVEDFFDLAERAKSVEVIFNALHQAITTARVSERVPDDTREKGWSYAMSEDHAVRTTAARIMAEILGLMPKAGAVNVNLQDNSVQITVEQQLREIVSLGQDPSEVLAELRTVVENAGKAAALAPADEVPKIVDSPDLGDPAPAVVHRPAGEF